MVLFVVMVLWKAKKNIFLSEEEIFLIEKLQKLHECLYVCYIQYILCCLVQNIVAVDLNELQQVIRVIFDRSKSCQVKSSFFIFTRNRYAGTEESKSRVPIQNNLQSSNFQSKYQFKFSQIREWSIQFQNSELRYESLINRVPDISIFIDNEKLTTSQVQVRSKMILDPQIFSENINSNFNKSANS